MASWLFCFRLPHKSQKVGSDRKKLRKFEYLYSEKAF